MISRYWSIAGNLRPQGVQKLAEIGLRLGLPRVGPERKRQTSAGLRVAVQEQVGHEQIGARHVEPRLGFVEAQLEPSEQTDDRLR